MILRKCPPASFVWVVYHFQFWVVGISFASLSLGRPFYRLLANGHPLKLILLVVLALGISWNTDRMFSFGELSPVREWSWTILSGLVSIAGLAILGFEALSKGIISLTGTQAFVFVLALIAIQIISRLFLNQFPRIGHPPPTTNAEQVSVSPQPANSTSPSRSDSDQGVPQSAVLAPRMSVVQLSIVGQNVAIIIMVMAMFYYAIEIDPTEGPRIKWGEVGAILIIFLLAELGVALVVRAEAIGERVNEATRIAGTVIEEAKKLAPRVDEISSKSKEMFDAAGKELVRVEKVAHGALQNLDGIARRLAAVASSNLWRKSAPDFYNAVSLDEMLFWESLENFTLDWTPRSLMLKDGAEPVPNTGTPDKKTRDLVRVLFESFIGKERKTSEQQTDRAYRTKGTVQNNGFDISCITADTVFAEASVEWLEVMAEASQKENKRLAVWAISTLLPTDFAFPSIWWGNTADEQVGKERTRTAALERFVGAVIDMRQTGKSIATYRRITVVNPRELPSGYREKWDNHTGHTLYNWLLWDPRAQKTTAKEVVSADEVENISRDLAGIVWKLRGGDMNDLQPNSQDLTWKTIAHLYGQLSEKDLREIHVFPDLKKSVSPVFNFFHNLFRTRDETRKGGVIAASSEILAHELSVEELRNQGLSVTFLDKLNSQFRNETFSLLDVYSFLGWSRLIDWYCENMHRGDGNRGGAWWAILKDKADLESLKPLSLEWDGFELLPLDLLLIGTEPEPSTEGEPHWLGAAISDIGFLRPQCTVQLITNAERLQSIAQAVKELCNNFNPSISQPDNSDVEIFGRWADWKNPEEGVSAAPTSASQDPVS